MSVRSWPKTLSLKVAIPLWLSKSSLGGRPTRGKGMTGRHFYTQTKKKQEEIPSTYMSLFLIRFFNFFFMYSSIIISKLTDLTSKCGRLDTLCQTVPSEVNVEVVRVAVDGEGAWAEVRGRELIERQQEDLQRCARGKVIGRDLKEYFFLLFILSWRCNKTTSRFYIRKKYQLYSITENNTMLF